MLIASLAVLFILVGALIYALSTNPKLAEIGRLILAAGLFAVAFAAAPHLVTLLGK